MEYHLHITAQVPGCWHHANEGPAQQVIDHASSLPNAWLMIICGRSANLMLFSIVAGRIQVTHEQSQPSCAFYMSTALEHVARCFSENRRAFSCCLQFANCPYLASN